MALTGILRHVFRQIRATEMATEGRHYGEISDLTETGVDQEGRPSGNGNDVFAGGNLAYPNRPIKTWTEGQLGTAIFGYEGELIENFLTVAA